MKIIRRHKRIAIFAVLAVFVMAGVASAYWTAGGGGSGTAATANPTTPLVVHQTSTVSGLFPGGAPVTLSGNFDNPNSVPIHVGAVTAALGAFTLGFQNDLSKPACTPADFTLGGSALVNVEVNAGTAVGSWSGLTIQMVDSATNQDNCKNVTVPIVYTAS